MRQRILLELLTRPQDSFVAMLLDAAPVGVSVALDGRITYANPSCARMWGYDRPEEMHGVPFFSLIAPESRPFVERLWNARKDGSEEPWVYELVGMRSNSEPFTYRCSSLSFQTPDGRKATFAFLEDLGDECPTDDYLRCRCRELLAELGE